MVGEEDDVAGGGSDGAALVVAGTVCMDREGLSACEAHWTETERRTRRPWRQEAQSISGVEGLLGNVNSRDSKSCTASSMVLENKSVFVNYRSAFLGICRQWGRFDLYTHPFLYLRTRLTRISPPHLQAPDWDGDQ